MTLSNIVAGVLRRMLDVAMPFSAAHREAVANAVPFEPAQGWILVSNGSVSDVRAAISDYDGACLNTHSAVFRQCPVMPTVPALGRMDKDMNPFKRCRSNRSTG